MRSWASQTVPQHCYAWCQWDSKVQRPQVPGDYQEHVTHLTHQNTSGLRASGDQKQDDLGYYNGCGMAPSAH